MGSDAGHAAKVARKRLIESHLPLVRSIARRYADREEALDDLVPAGALGSIKASNRFDPNQGVSFADFATPSIEGAIRSHLQATALTQRNRPEPQERRDIEPVAGADQSRHILPVSANPSHVDLTSEADASGNSDDRIPVTSGLRSLDERERQIVLLWLRGDLNEREIGRQLGISQRHLSRLLATALEKLRVDLAGSERPSAPVISPGAHDARSGESPPGGKGTRDTPKTSGSAKSKGGATHNGRFLLRMPSELHDQVAREAERRQVSLNRFITGLLSDAISSDSTAAIPDLPDSTTRVAGPADAPAVQEGRSGDAPGMHEERADAPPVQDDRAKAPAAREDTLPGEDPSHEASQSLRRPLPHAVKLALIVNFAVVVVAGIIAIALLAHSL